MTAPSTALDPPVVFESGEPIALHNITVPDRLRALREDTIAELVASFAEIGLINSITVRPGKSGFTLVAGRHRLEAARCCGWESIRCTILHDIDADKAEIVEIDENLIRAELSPAEWAARVARRKKLFEKAHPETKHGGDRKSPGSSSQDENLKSFVADTAKKTGKGRSTVARAVTRANKVVVLDEIVGTSLDKGAEIDALAKLPEPEQRELAARAKAGEKVSAKPAKAKLPKSAKEASPTATKARIADQADHSDRDDDHPDRDDRIDVEPEAKPAVATVPVKTPASILIRIADLARDCRGLMAHPQQNVHEIRKKLSQIIKLSDPNSKGRARATDAAKSNAKLDQKLFRRAMALESGSEAPAPITGNDVDTEQSAEERRRVNEALASNGDLPIPECLRRNKEIAS